MALPVRQQLDIRSALAWASFWRGAKALKSTTQCRIHRSTRHLSNIEHPRGERDGQNPQVPGAFGGFVISKRINERDRSKFAIVRDHATRRSPPPLRDGAKPRIT